MVYEGGEVLKRLENPKSLLYIKGTFCLQIQFKVW